MQVARQSKRESRQVLYFHELSVDLEEVNEVFATVIVAEPYLEWTTCLAEPPTLIQDQIS